MKMDLRDTTTTSYANLQQVNSILSIFLQQHKQQQHQQAQLQPTGSNLITNNYHDSMQLIKANGEPCMSGHYTLNPESQINNYCTTISSKHQIESYMDQPNMISSIPAYNSHQELHDAALEFMARITVDRAQQRIKVAHPLGYKSWPRNDPVESARIAASIGHDDATSKKMADKDDLDDIIEVEDQDQRGQLEPDRHQRDLSTHSQKSDDGSSTTQGSRIRTAYNSMQILNLEREFNRSMYLSRIRRIELAQKLELSEKQVKIWFQNRRVKYKKESCINLN